MSEPPPWWKGLAVRGTLHPQLPTGISSLKVSSEVSGRLVVRRYFSSAMQSSPVMSKLTILLCVAVHVQFRQCIPIFETNYSAEHPSNVYKFRYILCTIKLTMSKLILKNFLSLPIKILLNIPVHVLFGYCIPKTLQLI